MVRTLTDMQILQLAWDAQLAQWSREKDRLDSRPNSEFCKAREEKHWKRLQEIESLMEELKNQK